MEFEYINKIDEIIENKDKLKELLVYLLKTNIKQHNNYEGDKLFKIFSDQTLDTFVSIINNMGNPKDCLNYFADYLDKFHQTPILGRKAKMYFILDNNLWLYHFSDQRIRFEEYLLRCSKWHVKDDIQIMIEYYHEYNKINVIKERIDEMYSLKSLKRKTTQCINFRDNLQIIYEVYKNDTNEELKSLSLHCLKYL
jgi:hypothetical protein